MEKFKKGDKVLFTMWVEVAGATFPEDMFGTIQEKNEKGGYDILMDKIRNLNGWQVQLVSNVPADKIKLLN